MDDKDFRILVELFRHPFATDVDLGRAAAVSSTSARRRVDAMQAEQIIAGFLVVPSAAILARQAFTVTAKPNIAASYFPVRLLEVGEVVWAIRSHDGALTVGLFLPPGRDPASVGFGADKGWEARPATPSAAKGPSDVSPEEWRLIDTLIDDPRQEVPELARRTGLTPRTLRTRRDNILTTGLLDVRPVLLAPQGPGVVLFHLDVTLRLPDAAADVRAAIGSGLVVRETMDPPILSFLCRANSIAAAQDVQRRMAARPDVAGVTFTLPREAAVARDRLHAWVRAAAVTPNS